MANVLILSPNRFDAASVEGGDWQVPLSVLHDPIPFRVARSRSLDLAATRFSVILDRPRNIRAVVPVNHNGTTSARYRMTIFDGRNLPVYRSGVDANDNWVDFYPRIYSTRQLQWRDENWWSGRPTGESLAGIPQTLPIVLPSLIYGQRFDFEIDDRTNPAGLFSLGRVFLAGQYQPVSNYDFGASLGIEDESTAKKSRGGVLFFSRRRKRRVMRFGFTNMDEQEAFGRNFDLMNQAGTTEEVFVVADADDGANLQRRSFLGHFRTLSSIEQATLLRANLQYEIEEL